MKEAELGVNEKYEGHPMYQDMQRLKLQCLGDYLQLGAMMWARHHNVELPIVDEELRQELEIDLEEFERWLLGNVDNFRVIEGGRSKGGGDEVQD